MLTIIYGGFSGCGKTTLAQYLVFGQNVALTTYLTENDRNWGHDNYPLVVSDNTTKIPLEVKKWVWDEIETIGKSFSTVKDSVFDHPRIDEFLESDTLEAIVVVIDIKKISKSWLKHLRTIYLFDSHNISIKLEQLQDAIHELHNPYPTSLSEIGSYKRRKPQSFLEMIANPDLEYPKITTIKVVQSRFANA
jgi:hypothetical protein